MRQGWAERAGRSRAADVAHRRTDDRRHRVKTLYCFGYSFGQLQTSEPLSNTTRQTPGASSRQVELNLANTTPSGFGPGRSSKRACPTEDLDQIRLPGKWRARRLIEFFPISGDCCFAAYRLCLADEHRFFRNELENAAWSRSAIVFANATSAAVTCAVNCAYRAPTLVQPLRKSIKRKAPTGSVSFSRSQLVVNIMRVVGPGTRRQCSVVISCSKGFPSGSLK